jgi:lysophospholipase L1-like esterase
MVLLRALLKPLPVLLALALLATNPAHAGSMTYLALGDSVAFGETDFSRNPSYGDRGYVGPYASFLADKSGGVRPTVVNLAVDGETSSSFFSGTGRNWTGPAVQSPTLLNLNYSTPSLTQNSLMLETIQAQHAAGNTIGTVSVQLGANDLFSVMNSPGFFTLTSAQQQQLILVALGRFQQNETLLLTQIRSELPSANLILPGYYNPYAVDPTSPLAGLAGTAIQGLNSIIAKEALAFGGHYFDTYSAFVGHEAEYTYILSGNVHPNEIGYGVIAQRIEAVPEPATLSIFAVALAGYGLSRRRKSAAMAA